MSLSTTDIARIRHEARQDIEAGAVTPTYGADRQAVIDLLMTALATEWVCVLRYSQHEIVASGIHATAVAAQFAEHAAEEHRHAMLIARRIKQLGGAPSFDPAQMRAKSHSEYAQSDSLEGMIKENLIAERIAVESYTEAIKTIGEQDPTTRRLLEEILAKEEEHADEMADLLPQVRH